MNKILSKDIEWIKNYFEEEKFPDISVVITGSVAREEDHWDDGINNSDLDMLVVIREANQIDYLLNKLKRINKLFQQKTTFILTVEENFVKSKNRGYVRSIKKTDNILYDQLEIKQFIKDIFDEPIDLQEQYRSYFQEFCYYYSKWLDTQDSFQKNKALNDWNKICHFNGSPCLSGKFPSHSEVEKTVVINNISLLPSSQRFISPDFYGKKGTFKVIQNLVLLENQGIEATRCSVELKYDKN